MVNQGFIQAMKRKYDEAAALWNEVKEELQLDAYEHDAFLDIMGALNNFHEAIKDFEETLGEG